MDYLKFAEQYIRKQEKFYNRPLRSLNKFLIKDFAQAITKVNGISSTPQRTVDFQDNDTQVALITEDVGHLTGGRYYAWFIASALLELGFEVTVYTNKKPVFTDYFDKYKQPRVNVVVSKAKELEDIDIRADVYIGSPISGNIAASRLGKLYQKPSYALIFDPFPFMAKYLGEKRYVGWTPLINEISDSNTKIINLCNTTSESIYEWLNKKPEDVIPIYPCVNSRENQSQNITERENYILFISRLVNHKNFDHALKAAKNLGVRLKVVSSIDAVGAVRMVEKSNMRKQVDFYFKCTEAEKFELIRKAMLVVNPSTFEGFGLYLAEAISCGTPVVCYEFPTFREIQEFAESDNIYYAEYDNKQSFQDKIELALSEKKFAEPSNVFNFEAMVEKVSEVFSLEPKIGVITIALNEEEYIEQSLKAITRHPNVKKVAVVEGAVNLFAHASTEDGLSKDKTSDKIHKVMKTNLGKKIIYERYGWAVDKSELRNRALLLLGKDITHVLVVDGDEVWKQEDLDNLVKGMKENPGTGVFLFPFYHFWKQKNLIARGGQWESMLFRCFRYTNKSLHWNLHHLPVVDQDGKFLNVTHGSVVLPDVHVYHFGYVKNQENILNKLEYYKKRDGDKLKVKDTWSNWRMGKPTQPTHGGGTAVKFSGTLPEEMR
jgi:glycosyltransferase involved in cell wall biosynthesis